ncbi:MAG: LLM class flavin-dependent oxidoreductase [Actinobacteria bacterium]|nr:LLM class flavin-dependent oxidoreductase [Actinomycetota bacterium]
MVRDGTGRGGLDDGRTAPRRPAGRRVAAPPRRGLRRATSAAGRLNADETTPPLRVGLRLPQYAASWSDLRSTASRAEALGFHSVWLNDHFWTPGRRHADGAFEATTAVAALAEVTMRVALGTVVLSASFRAPALTAKLAATLDVITSGRLILGLGTGSDEAEHAAFGIPFPSPRERTSRLVATLDAVIALAEHPGGATVVGVLADAPGYPAAIQLPHAPIWLAAHGPKLLRLAGARADGIIAAFVAAPEIARRLAVARSARGPDRPPLACASYSYVLPATSRREALRWLVPEADALGSTPERVLRWLEGVGFVGAGADLRAHVAELAAAGVTDAIFVMPNRVPIDAVDALADALRLGAPPHAPRSPDVSARSNLVDILAARHIRDGNGARIAAVDSDGEWTFDELGEATARAAGALAACGVRRGERAVIALRDGRAWLAAFLGTASIGAVAVPVDPSAPSARLAEILDDCEPTCVVAEDDVILPRATARLTPDALERGAPRPPVAVHESDLAYLVYSSGSTGRPKGAMHSHGDLRTGIGTYATSVLDLGPGDRCHSAARLFTSLGFGNGFFRALGRGATLVLNGNRPNVRTVLSTVAAHRVTVLTGVPTFWAQLAEFASRHPIGDALASVRLAVSSGDSLPGPILTRIRDGMGVELIEGLGCSECSNIVISTRPGESLPGRLGRAVPGIDIRLADPDGHTVADGEPGRLWIKSASNTSGYWRRPDLTRDLVHGEWVRMGDVLVVEAGVYRHVGRADDLFKVDGLWVSPAEIEAALHSHGDVREAAVVGVPDERGLMRPLAYVVPTTPTSVTGEDLRRHVVRELDARRAPTHVRIVSDLPRLASGKLDRRALREPPDG